MKHTFVTKTALEDMVKTYPTPFHLYDEQGIRENARRLKAAFSWNAGYREFFAVKATPNPVILSILKEEGFGLDCATYTELMLAEAIGVKGHHVMFSSNVTPGEDFLYAHQMGAHINLDDFTHIETLERLTGLPESICCRYNPGNDFDIEGDIFDTPATAKYGFTFDQLVTGFQYMKARGVQHFGLHALLASNTVNHDYYPRLARLLFEAAVRLRDLTGVHIAFVNLSGGIGIPYHPDQQPADIEAIGRAVQEAFEEILVPAGMGDVSIYSELGRFILGPYGCLVTRAVHEKQIYKHYIGVDACAADLLRPAMYGAYHHITVAGKELLAHDHCYDITGGLCENNDKFAIDRMLPEIDLGDFLIIHDTGAHGYAMGYNYNGKLRSAEVLLKADGTTALIRRAEQPKDYFATLDFLKLFRD